MSDLRDFLEGQLDWQNLHRRNMLALFLAGVALGHWVWR